jgi:anti-sigma factor RsiW
MHLTDEQLNEYLDGEIKDRANVEVHLSACGDCAARLTALQALFVEIMSLPELALSHNLAAPITRRLSRGVALPRSLRLTVILQATAAIIAIILAAPFVLQWFSPYLASLPAPSFLDLFLQMQSQWASWLDMLSQFQPPAMPEIPVMDVSSLFMILTIIGVSLLWLIGNGLLLRNQVK